MKNIVAIIITKNHNVKIFKFSKIPDKFVWRDHEYLVQNDCLYFQKRTLGYKRYMFFLEDNSLPIRYIDASHYIDTDSTIVKQLLNYKVLNDFMMMTKQPIFMYLFIMLFGLIFGIILGIVIAPHIIVMHSTTTILNKST